MNLEAVSVPVRVSSKLDTEKLGMLFPSRLDFYNGMFLCKNIILKLYGPASFNIHTTFSCDVKLGVFCSAFTCEKLLRQNTLL